MLIKEQGVELLALNFKTPFCLCDGKQSSGCTSHSRALASELGIEFRVISVIDEFFRVLKNPRHGYGSNMNPCIDCRILKFRLAAQVMRQSGASFIITGEVLGQRPMSQHRQALSLIERESGLEGLVLRPLSAQLLPETLPEKNGWVERNKLLAFSGRSRRPQMDLAESFNFKDYPCPAGGCLLTDPGFSARMKDLLSHGELNVREVELLKFGRHFRLSDQAKLIVGRDERENQRLESLADKDDWLFFPEEGVAGPLALGKGPFDPGLIELACRITASYCDAEQGGSLSMLYRKYSVEAVGSLACRKSERTEFLSLRI
jgi:tRNA U34 2-thiouridine synthase MnmA/TrmU